jgi:hypothetical protein
MLSDKSEIYLNGSLSQTDGAFDTLHIHAYSDVPIDLIDQDATDGGIAGELPGPGDDGVLPGEPPEATDPALKFHDYDFTEVHDYSNLEYDELRITLGANYEVLPSVKLFGAVALYDLDDNEPYLQNTTGSVTVVSGGITWMF